MKDLNSNYLLKIFYDLSRKMQIILYFQTTINHQMFSCADYILFRRKSHEVCYTSPKLINRFIYFVVTFLIHLLAIFVIKYTYSKFLKKICIF